jgi:hypothetical protein
VQHGSKAAASVLAFSANRLSRQRRVNLRPISGEDPGQKLGHRKACTLHNVDERSIRDRIGHKPIPKINIVFNDQKLTAGFEVTAQRLKKRNVIADEMQCICHENSVKLRQLDLSLKSA